MYFAIVKFQDCFVYLRFETFCLISFFKADLLCFVYFVIAC